MNQMRIKAGPRLSRVLSERGAGGASGGAKVRLGGRGAALASLSGGTLLGGLPPDLIVRAVVVAVHSPGGPSAPALPSEVTYDVRAIGRDDLAVMTLAPEWRTVQNDEVPIWPRPVLTPCLLVEWPDETTQRRWRLFLPEAIAFFDCPDEGGAA